MNRSGPAHYEHVLAYEQDYEQWIESRLPPRPRAYLGCPCCDPQTDIWEEQAEAVERAEEHARRVSDQGWFEWWKRRFSK
jgi:hypothetical protein